MSSTSNALSRELLDYLARTIGPRETEPQRRLREVTAEHPRAEMQISVEQGQLMAMLVRLIGARRALEVGTFTGYSALAVAQALPPDGQLVACDVSEEYTAIGKPFWAEAGVADRIDLRIAPARDSLAAMIDDGQAGTFDFAFVDADKEGQDGYYEQCLVLLRDGGVLGIDNAFMGGRVAAPDEAGPRAVRALTEKIYADDRVDPALIPIGDGLLLVRKRAAGDQASS